MNFYEEKIEEYLAGKLNAADKTALEEGMRKDPLLKNEVELQRDIIESLKNSRKIQLKNRLNNIDVTTSNTAVSSTVKIAASLITVGIIGAGVYYLSVFSTKGKEKENVTVVLNENVKAYTSQNNDSNTITNNSTTINMESGSNKATQSTENQKNTNNTNSKAVQPVANKTNKGTNSTREEVNVQANVPNGVIADTETDRLNRDITVNIPDGSIGETNVGKAENVDVSISDKNKKDFSYQFYNNKLFLYGDFNEQPYNLFEINSPKSKQLYLYFDGKYYELKSNQTKVTRLKEVKDASILNHLNK